MNLFRRLLRLFRRKSAPAFLPPASAHAYLDAYRAHRSPTPAELLASLKNTAWTCTSINAAVCASYPPKLFVATGKGQAPPRCRTRALAPATVRKLSLRSPAANNIEEVIEHPLLALLRQVNPIHNSFDLWELTQLYLEVHGSAYWLLDFDAMLNVPSNIYVLPAHLVTPKREPSSSKLVDHYEFRGQDVKRFAPERIIHFRFPDPRDPYTSGVSPLRACFEQVALTSEYAALKRSLYDNAGLPSAIIGPEGMLGTGERDRLEAQFQEKFRRGGQGKALVTDSKIHVTLLSQSLGDLAALADIKATKEDIANAFHVPLPFLTGDTNLANMQAADHLHKTLAIGPRLRRRDEKLNEQLVPLFDPSGRLFLASDDPTPENREFGLKQEALDLRLGVRTINEVRSSRGLPSVPWGEKPVIISN
ncbi:MAG: phage portal protein [Gemmataceae bacterium]|nr:phage portal protein [Gemmataceae bacterium]MCI0741305.1 phage portal protein [Gemmataceae bacterium]